MKRIQNYMHAAAVAWTIFKSRPQTRSLTDPKQKALGNKVIRAIEKRRNNACPCQRPLMPNANIERHEKARQDYTKLEEISLELPELFEYAVRLLEENNDRASTRKIERLTKAWLA